METPNCYFYYLLGEDRQQIEIKYNQFCINEFQQNKRYFRVIKKRIHKINTVKLMSLLVELNNSMEMGMTLNQAISSIASSGDKQLSCLCLYISQQINNGVSVHQSVSNVCDKATRFLCEFLPENTTQEGFKKSLAIIIQYLKSRKEVSDKLVKSLYYPYFIAQSSSIIMIINAIMKDAFELSLLAIYGLTCGVQAVILYLVISGKIIFF
ncbi:type II secretion system F family protein [Marinomonas sp. 15G1-11]|uniref:Type II secretion system F family protein n=1 Tax=Marinomonas phaeophyticola TaxID=3004091 RepID=A0ABT4JQ39_9GAMM|nr:type II secretion system F family protein [Marinomonas sp. 15G1-11]MCZ2720470.1 type II secretion system F family protein [Marinomonas sp. 15G1-11]